MTNKITGRFSVLLLVGGLLAGTTAQAEKYIVSFKNRSAFSQVHSQFMMQRRLELGDVRFFSDLPVSPLGTRVQVEDSLQSLAAVVIETDDKAQIEALRASGLIGDIEAEFFHPAPKPIQGFKPWTPWTVDLNLMSANAKGAGAVPYGIRLVRSPEAWALSGHGGNARVLVLDTGLDVNHPAVAANFEKGKDFLVAGESSDITDMGGHGTHVAGTVAAVSMADGFSGVAPEAKILMGRVCGDQGCSNISVARGINWGIQEKVDVITMSLGGPLGSLSEKRAVEAADAAGVTVIAASGNDGSGRVSFPAAFPTVVAVGAVDSSSKRANFSQYGPELDVVAPGVAVVSSVPVGSGRESKVSVTLAGTERDVKSAAFAGAPEVRVATTNEVVNSGLGKPGDFTSAVVGKYALISRGEIAFSDKVKNAIAAGAAGAVIYNNEPGLIQGALTNDGSLLSIPAMMIEQTVGKDVVAALAKGEKVSVTLQTMATDYAAFDGTSMATPHVAGVAALVKSANKKLTPAQVREIFSTTSRNVGSETEYAKGLVDAEAAVKKALSL